MSKSNVLTNIYDEAFSTTVVGSDIIDIPECKLVKVENISLFLCEITLVTADNEEHNYVVEKDRDYEIMVGTSSLHVVLKKNIITGVYSNLCFEFETDVDVDFKRDAHFNEDADPDNVSLTDAQKIHIEECNLGVFPKDSESFRNVNMDTLTAKFNKLERRYDEEQKNAIKCILNANPESSEERRANRKKADILINHTPFINPIVRITPLEFFGQIDKRIIGQDIAKEKMLRVYSDYYYNMNHHNSGIVVFKGRSADYFCKAFCNAADVKMDTFSLVGNTGTISDSLHGSSTIYSNCEIGPLAEKIFHNPNGVLYLKGVDKMAAELSDIIYDLADSRLYINQMLECPVYFKNMFLFASASEHGNIPENIASVATIIETEDYTDSELFDIGIDITGRFREKYDAWNIAITDDAMHDIVKYIHKNSISDIELNIKDIFVSCLAKNNVYENVVISKETLPDYFDLLKNKELYRSQYVEDFENIIKKRIALQDELPKDVVERLEELEEVYYTDENRRDYCLDVSKRLVNCNYNAVISADIPAVSEAIRREIYSNQNAKESLLDILYYNNRNKEELYPVLLHSAPGHGKTSLVETLASALNIKCVRLQLRSNESGVSFGNEKVGSFYDKLTAKEYRSNASLLFIDEADKLNDREIAQLATLISKDDRYYDKYYQCYMPKNFIVVMAVNDVSKLPAYFQNRCNIVKMSSYSNSEKLIVAKEHILPKLLAKEGCKDKRLVFPDKVINYIIKNYVFDSGIRELEKSLMTIVSRIERTLEDTPCSDNRVVSIDDVKNCLGSTYLHAYNRTDRTAAKDAGVSTALAVLGNTGCSFNIVVSENPYKRKNEVVGLVSKSVRNSVDDAIKIAQEMLHRKIECMSIRIVDSGTKVDGPSAGVAILAAILSHCLHHPLPNRVAFTGEIVPTKNGRIFSIGGIEEKLCAAERIGIKKVYIPVDNYKELREGGRLDKYALKVVPVSNAEELLTKLDLKKYIREDTGWKIINF